MTQKIPQGGVIVTARLNNNHLGGFCFLARNVTTVYSVFNTCQTLQIVLLLSYIGSQTIADVRESNGNKTKRTRKNLTL